MFPSSAEGPGQAAASVQEAQGWQHDLLRGLLALVASSFPKHCQTCGRTFATAEEFLATTQGIGQNASGCKEAIEDDGSTIVEVFRNCPCGSTLMDVFGDRRDVSAAGVERRRLFAELLQQRIGQGVAAQVARRQLLHVLRGGTDPVPAGHAMESKPPVSGADDGRVDSSPNPV